MGEIAENRDQLRHCFLPNSDTYEKYERGYCYLHHFGQNPLYDFQNSSLAIHNSRHKIMTNTEKRKYEK